MTIGFLNGTQKGVLPVNTKKKKSNPGKKKQNRYPLEFKLRAVRLRLEEGYTVKLIAEELGVGYSTLSSWIKRYREEGEAGLEFRTPAPNVSRRAQISPAVKDKAVELKKADSTRGVRRISHLLRRNYLMKASPETVRRTLKEEELLEPPKKKPHRNPAKPRFFERSTPNQMWQTDIFCFRLGGRNAYLIGYIDDYSRYITGLALYRSQTAEHVIETFRRSVAEYGVPKEMLTDNGRQYTNWRGTTRFEKELKKDRIAHIKSQPHHPMTLGKIERFWKSIYAEFLSRVQFDSFEEAQRRLALWVKYYNYKRPHQGIGGLCPADRFFEIQSELRQVLERGIEENVLESALRGMPHKPFYMVGRMGEQSVVIRAEKGKVKMLLDGEEAGKEKELVYHVNESEKDRDEEAETGVCGPGEMQSGTGRLERAPQTGGDLPGAGDSVATAEQLAGCGDEGDAACAGAPADPGRSAVACTEPARGETAGESGSGGKPPIPGGSASGVDPEDDGCEEESVIHALVERVALLDPADAAIVLELLDGKGRSDYESERTRESGDDPEGTRGADERGGSRPQTGGQPQDLLQMGAAGTGSDDGGPLRAELGPAARRRGWRAGETDPPHPGAGA